MGDASYHLDIGGYRFCIIMIFDFPYMVSQYVLSLEALILNWFSTLKHRDDLKIMRVLSGFAVIIMLFSYNIYYK